jgi:hypothetical protein
MDRWGSERKIVQIGKADGEKKRAAGRGQLEGRYRHLEGKYRHPVGRCHLERPGRRIQRESGAQGFEGRCPVGCPEGEYHPEGKYRRHVGRYHLERPQRIQRESGAQGIEGKYHAGRYHLERPRRRIQRESGT